MNYVYRKLAVFAGLFCFPSDISRIIVPLPCLFLRFKSTSEKNYFFLCFKLIFF
jgi:hypothetical protein